MGESSEDRQPNGLLAWERLQRGWSYEELAKRVREEMARAGELETGLTANTVRRWETGQRRPEPRYRKHLVVIVGKPAQDLGLLTQEELAMRPVEDVARECGRLVDMVADGVGAQGMDRAAFLRGLLSAAVAPQLVSALGHFDDTVVERVAQVLGGGARVDAASVDAYIEVTARDRTLYWSAPPAPMFKAARTHVDLGTHLLAATHSPDERTRLAAAIAETALLAARIAFFDLQNPDAAVPMFDTAFDACRESGDHAWAAGIYAHAAFVPGFAGEATRARAYLDAAHAHAAHGVGPVTRSWLHAVSAEIAARTGQPEACLHRVSLAEAALERDGEDPAWLDFFDAGRLDGFAGYCCLIAGDHPRAHRRLTDALEDLPETERKQRSVLLADLGAAVSHDDREQAATHLHDAIDSLARDWYAIGYSRVLDHRHIVEDTRHADDITERLDTLSIS